MKLKGEHIIIGSLALIAGVISIGMYKKYNRNKVAGTSSAEGKMPVPEKNVIPPKPTHGCLNSWVYHPELNQWCCNTGTHNPDGSPYIICEPTPPTPMPTPHSACITKPYFDAVQGKWCCAGPNGKIICWK